MEKSSDLKSLKDREEIDLSRMYISNFSDVQMKSDALLKNIVVIGDNYPELEVDFNKVWHISENRTWLFRIQSLSIIDPLLKQYRLDKAEKYIDKCKEIFMQWESNNPLGSNNELSWHDHSTAIRLLMISFFFEVVRVYSWDEKFLECLYNSAKQHMELLSSSEFYMPAHNHGVDQDVCLFIGATVFSNFDQSKKYQKLAIERLKKQSNTLFGYDGSYLEHSPQYSVILTNRLVQFNRFIKNYAEKYDEEYFEDVIAKQMEFMLNIFYPSMEIGHISDSVNRRITKSSFDEYPPDIEDNFDYMFSRGEKGVSPEYTNKIFPQGNYCVLRNKWEYDLNTIQVIFHSSFHSRVHKHHDDLSCSVFAFGIPIIMDGGKYSYDYNNDYRKYVISNRAHNTVTIDDENSNIMRLNIEKSGLTRYYFSENIEIVKGAHCLYDGVVHSRTVIYFKPNIIIIIDDINGCKIHKMDQYFHFHPSVQLKQDTYGIEGSVDENKFYIKQYLNARDKMQVGKGEKNPVNGYRSLGHLEVSESYYLKTSLSGKDGRFITGINLSENKTSEIKNICDKVFVKEMDFCVEVDCNPLAEEVMINNCPFRFERGDAKEVEAAVAYERKTSTMELYRTIYEGFNGNPEEELEIEIIDEKDKKYLKCNFPKELKNVKIAWYVYKDNQLFFKTDYDVQRTIKLSINELGSYKVKAFLMHDGGSKITVAKMVAVV